MDSKLKLGLPVKKLQNNLKNWGIHNLSSVIISRVLRILTSKNMFQSLHAIYHVYSILIGSSSTNPFSLSENIKW